MTSTPSHASRKNGIESGHDWNALLYRLEAAPSLFERQELKARLIALDDLDRSFADPEFTRAKALRARLEAANEELYQSFRTDMIRGALPRGLLEWLQVSESQSNSRSPSPGLGFDWRDELVTGIFRFREPSELDIQGSPPEMVPYQPTPVRHILQLIAANVPSQDDLFVDLGSGLGHVPLLVCLLTGIRSVGIELQAAYVATAQECAQRLNLNRVQFVAEDVRAADLSTGTVFYLYTPFHGSILAGVLRALRRESRRRSIKICSLGPCTATVANEAWLKATTPPDTERITVFASQ